MGLASQMSNHDNKYVKITKIPDYVFNLRKIDVPFS